MNLPRPIRSISPPVLITCQSHRAGSKAVKGVDERTELTIQQLRKEIVHYGELGDKVMDQTKRRVTPFPTPCEIASARPHRGRCQDPVLAEFRDSRPWRAASGA